MGVGSGVGVDSGVELTVASGVGVDDGISDGTGVGLAEGEAVGFGCRSLVVGCGSS